MSALARTSKEFALDKRVEPGWYLFVQGMGTFKILNPDEKYKSKLIIPVENIDPNAQEQTRIFTIEELDCYAREL